ncbi:unnamed protein product [Blepharisma stoltei]|uniref:Galactokinase n=1 Tax=Blepharisma stoltei TaxID=1481888 RepID=A0AAU9JNJ5_9CILI|nr:unnamed protein product [Blepharisma stoltei]
MDYVEVVESVREIYDKDQTAKYDFIAQRFFHDFGSYPGFFARAPGRVNIIGEHIDYSGYPVLPMALDRDTIMAVRRTEMRNIVIKNIQRNKFPEATFSLDQKLSDEHVWTNYFVAGYRSVTEEIPVENRVGMLIMVDGDVPIASGLSSSASFTVCAALATLYANNPFGKTSYKEYLPEDHPKAKNMLEDYYVASTRISKIQLAELTTRFERMVGTQCGGMDQTISILAEAGTASFIEFNPIRLEAVPLPSGCTFVIANSLTPSPKVLTIATRYNKRVVECRIAVALIAKAFNLPIFPKTLKEIQEELGRSLEEMIEIVNLHIREEEYTTAMLEETFGTLLIEIVKDIQYSDIVLNNNTSYKPRQRALHVYNEAKRVYEFKNVCQNNGDCERLGRLMTESHNSCRDLYECSSEQLETLIGLAIEGGAIGSRLTGAGWGGCCISLVRNEQLEEMYRKMLKFYENNPLVTDDNVIFSTVPCRGACILESKYFAWAGQ